MNEPRSSVYILNGGGGYMVAETREDVLDSVSWPIAGDNGFITLHAITFEGHEMEVSIARSEIGSVTELTPERWQFELERFMAQRQSAQIDEDMRRSFAGLGDAATKEMREEE